jgi:hypothetical protein
MRVLYIQYLQVFCRHRSNVRFRHPPSRMSEEFEPVLEVEGLASMPRTRKPEIRARCCMP